LNVSPFLVLDSLISPYIFLETSGENIRVKSNNWAKQIAHK
jgi:hypothetical protein